MKMYSSCTSTEGSILYFFCPQRKSNMLVEAHWIIYTKKDVLFLDEIQNDILLTAYKESKIATGMIDRIPV